MTSINFKLNDTHEFQALVKSSPVLNRTLLNHFHQRLNQVNSKIHRLAKDFSNKDLLAEAENCQKALCTAIELNPDSFLPTTLFADILLSHNCKERAQLLDYLVLCGANSLNSRKEIREIERIKSTLSKAFAVGLELIKARQDPHSSLSSHPKEIIGRLASDAITVHCPYLFNLPGDFIIKKIPEFKHTQPSFFDGLLNVLKNWNYLTTITAAFQNSSF